MYDLAFGFLIDDSMRGGCDLDALEACLYHEGAENGRGAGLRSMTVNEKQF